MGNKLFVGNISWNSTEEDVKALFEQIGTVEEIKLIYDRERNRHKGFGFVTMASEEEAQRAMDELNDKDLDGRPIKISEARPQKEFNRE